MITSIPFQRSAEFISGHFNNVHHDIAIVLGSGLGGFTRHLSDKIVLDIDKIPDYPRSAVPGHVGEIIGGEIGGKRILVFNGRVHFYETESTIDSAVTAIVSYQLGIKKILLTNAAGILNEKFSPGDLMSIKDQINLTSRNILLDLKMPVVDLNPIYSEKLASAAFIAASTAD